MHEGDVVLGSSNCFVAIEQLLSGQSKALVQLVFQSQKPRWADAGGEGAAAKWNPTPHRGGGPARTVYRSAAAGVRGTQETPYYWPFQLLFNRAPLRLEPRGVVGAI